MQSDETFSPIFLLDINDKSVDQIEIGKASIRLRTSAPDFISGSGDEAAGPSLRERRSISISINAAEGSAASAPGGTRRHYAARGP